MIERSTPRVPRADSSARNGITPALHVRVEHVNVAPSRPIRTASVPRHTSRRFGWRCSQTNVASSATVRSRSSTGRWPISSKYCGKRQPPVPLLDHRREHHDLQRLETEVGDEPRLRPDLAVVLPVALRLVEQREDSLQHLWVRHGHRIASRARSRGRIRWTAVATIRSSSRCVQASQPAAGDVEEHCFAPGVDRERARGLRAPGEPRAERLAGSLSRAPQAQQPLLGGVRGQRLEQAPLRLGAARPARTPAVAGRAARCRCRPRPGARRRERGERRRLTLRVCERDDRQLGEPSRPGSDARPAPPGRRAGSRSRPAAARGHARRARARRRTPSPRCAPRATRAAGLGERERLEQLALAPAQHAACPYRLPQGPIGREPRVQAPAGDALIRRRA